jgi:hypothetical protein
MVADAALSVIWSNPRLKEATMHAKAFLRPMFIAVAFALMITSLGISPASAKGTVGRTDTMSREDIFVQACNGFAITSSYTTVRTYQVVEDPTGHAVFERRNVSFTGAVVNAANDKGFGYEGGFTRIADYEQNAIAISDLTLKLDLADQGEVSIAIDHRDRDVIDNPVAILLEYAPFTLRDNLCDFLGGSSGTLPQIPSQHQLDPCLSMPKGKPC